jgi:hypothetical protein
MERFFALSIEGSSNDLFLRDGDGRLIRRNYWLDLTDRSLVLATTQGIGRVLTITQKRAHLEDIDRQHLCDEICAEDR